MLAWPCHAELGQCLADSVLFLQLHGQPRRLGLVRQPGTYQDGGVIKTAVVLPADLNRLTRETDMLLANIDSLTDEEFAAPSKCEGWTRAHNPSRVRPRRQKRHSDVALGRGRPV